MDNGFGSEQTGIRARIADIARASGEFKSEGGSWGCEIRLELVIGRSTRVFKLSGWQGRIGKNE